MQDRIQLKREEVVGEGVALSDINPVTNTKSVDDDSAGVPLDVTIERLWQAINNSLSRVVNSVNGRSGIVVVTADDVGLGNVTNVSYGTIQEWVIKELADQFGVKRLMLFDTEAEMNAAMEGWRRDTGHANVPFYIRHNSTEDMRSFIGYFAWDDATAMLVPVKKAIDTIGYADNSIIYNESINGRALGNGGIGVNIWSGEDALKIYNASAIKSQSGLMIDKDKIAPHVYFYNGAYGNDATEGDLSALVYTDDGVTTATTHKLRINVKGITMTDPIVDTCQTFKKNDIIVCNFSDNGYRNNDGSLKSNVVPELVCRESMIGTVISVPDGVDPSSPYVIDFFPIKPYVGMGLKYYEVHTDATTNKKSTMIGIDLLTGKMTSAFIDANISGLNTFSSVDRSNVNIADAKVNYTVLPSGRHQTTLTNSSSAFISPDFSMNVVPKNIFGNESYSPITNWPTKTPGDSTSGPSSIGNQSFVGTNLLKKVDVTNKKAYNISGLRIVDPINEVITNSSIGKSDNDTTDKFDPDAGTTSGGLMVNVGKFLEIGVLTNDGANPYFDRSSYYDGGKVNVRVDEVMFSDTDNRLGLKVSEYTKFDRTDINDVIGGGLTISPGYDDPDQPDLKVSPGLAVNRGLGLRMSKYDRFGNIPVPTYRYELLTTEPDNFDPTQYYKEDGSQYVPGVVGDVWATDTWYNRITIEPTDKAFLAASVIDPQFESDFDHDYTDIVESMYGGLRYMVGPGRDLHNTSAIGLRVNNQTAMNGHELRLGSKAIGIDEENVVGVQLYREDISPINDINPLNIKSWDEFALYKYTKFPWMKDVTYDTKASLPQEGEPNVIYYIKADEDEGSGTHLSRRYIWDNGEYVPMFEYYGDKDDLPSEGNENKAYVVLKYDNLHHKIWGELYQWRPQSIIQVPLSWVPVTDPNDEKYPGYYDDDFRSPYGADATTGASILQYYAAIQTSKDRQGYLKDGSFYKDPGGTEELPKIVNALYPDISTPWPYVVYKWNGSAFVPFTDELSLRENIMTIDLDKDGSIDAVDSTICTHYYANASTSGGRAACWPSGWFEAQPRHTSRETFSYYMRHHEGVEEHLQSEYVKMHATAIDGSFIPGLDIDINEYQGMTTKLAGDIKKSVSIKIFDETAGCSPDDSEAVVKQGGLRFTTEGYLAVRVNETSSYNATTPRGRSGKDIQSSLFQTDHSDPQSYKSMEYPTGSRGLMVYPSNVLGIQLTHDSRSRMDDNGELCFDEYGSLHISPDYRGAGGQTLTITDGTNTFEYSGSEPKTLTLGPGLMLEPDPTPNNTPTEPTNEETPSEP